MPEEEQSDTNAIILITLTCLCLAAGLLVINHIYFKPVQRTSQEKAMLGNLRQIASAADQYFIEENTTQAQWTDLVGTDRYVKSIDPVNGEDYKTLMPINAGFTELTVRTTDGLTITYSQ